MNRIYNVIWSKTKKCYVVVSEIVKTGSGKAKSVQIGTTWARMSAIMAVSALLTGVMMPTDALGASIKNGIGAQAENDGGIAIGDSTNARGDYSVAIGTNATVGKTDPTESESQNGIAIGHGATVSVNPATATPGITDKSGGIAIGHDATTKDINAIAIGETAKSTGTNSIAIGTGAKAAGESTVGTNIPTSTVAIGQGAQALENGDIVIGRSAKSIVSTHHGNPGSGAVVMGAEAASYGARGDVAIGASAETNVKIKNDGGTVNPKYAQGVAIGSTAKTYGTQSLALGADTRAIGNSSVAIGGDDIDMARTELETAVPQLAAGNGIKKSFNKEIEDKFAGTLGSASINVKGKYANTAAIGDATTAIGTLSEAYGTGSTAIGINSLTKGVASTGIGIMTRSWGTNSLALGTQVGAYGDRSSSIGDTNQVGLDMKDGSKSGKESAAVGSKNTIYGNQAYAIGAGNTIGSATVMTTTEANGSGAGADQDTITTVTDGTVKGNMSGAFGYKNSITADNSYVVGSNSNVSADGAMVLGNNASVTAKNAVALGNNTKVDNESAVALGTGSETAAAVATPSATINGAVHNFAGINPASTVSVGKAGMERTITNVAAGRISDTSTDAINGSQLHAVTSEMDKGVAYAGDVKAASATANQFTRKFGEQTNIVGGVTDPTKLSDNNIGVVSNGTDTLNVKLAKELQGLTSTTFTNGGNNTVINGDGMTINRAGGDAVSLTKDGLNNGGNKITNVADGTDPNDAVNKSQLDKATAAASTTVSAGNNITVTPSTNANGSKNYEVSLKDQVTLGSDATKQIAMDGTTGTIKAGDKVTIDGNKGTIKAGNVTIDGENGTIKAGDKVTIDGKDGKIAAGKVAVDGKDGYVTGLENKDWDPDNITSGRAATEDQLQKSHKSLDNKINNLGDEITKKGMDFAGNTGEFHRNLGQKVTFKGEGTESDDKYSGENIKTVAENGNVTIKMAKDLKTDSLTTDKVKVGKNGQDGVSITGPNGADGTDGKVGITGKDGKDAVSMSGKDGIGHIGLNGKDGRSADITVEKGDPDLEGNEITRIKYQDENGKTHQVATKDDGMKYGGDSGDVIKKKLNEQVNVIGGITDASKLTTEDNLGVVSDGTGNLKVRMAKDLKGLETVTTKDAAGNTTVMNGGGVTITPASGNAVSLTKDGLNNGGNTITNVGPGVNGTDAVNLNQLKGATDGLANAINSVAGETQRVGAHAAALSALKPIQYDPLEPTQVMAGIGNYRGETAAALGIAHYTAEDTMFHVGMSVGSHHNMVNAGVTRKFGTSDAKKAVPERYKGGPISSIYVLQDEVTALKAENVRMQESLHELSSVKADNARMQQRIDELSSVKEDNEQMKAQIALLMQQAGLTK